MRRFVFFIVSLFVVFSLFSKDSFYEGIGGKNHKIMFAESILENGVYDKSDVWITDKIKTNLISALQRYGGFNCIDLTEAKSVLKVQHQLESGIYDDSQNIEIGKLIKAKEFVNIRTTRLPSGSYSISIMIFDVESGAILGTFTSPKTYDSAESYVIQAHYDCVSDILKRFDIQLAHQGSFSLQEEQRIAALQAEKNKKIAIENAKIEEERSEKAKAELERRSKIKNEEREKRKAKEKAEAEAARKALLERKTREKEAYERAKRQNPFVNEIYSCEFENGSRRDSYSINFVSQNNCSVTVASVDSRGNRKSFSGKGTYSYGNEMLSINIYMPNSEVKHVQKINWKGRIAFKNGYTTFFFMIPVNSNEDARKIRVEFQQKLSK